MYLKATLPSSATAASVQSSPSVSVYRASLASTDLRAAALRVLTVTKRRRSRAANIYSTDQRGTARRTVRRRPYKAGDSATVAA